MESKTSIKTVWSGLIPNEDHDALRVRALLCGESTSGSLHEALKELGEEQSHIVGPELSLSFTPHEEKILKEFAIRSLVSRSLLKNRPTKEQITEAIEKIRTAAKKSHIITANHKEGDNCCGYGPDKD